MVPNLSSSESFMLDLFSTKDIMLIDNSDLDKQFYNDSKSITINSFMIIYPFQQMRLKIFKDRKFFYISPSIPSFKKILSPWEYYYRL